MQPQHPSTPAPASRTRREPGQILLLFAVFVVLVLVLAGSAYDYGSILIDEARVQNAVDAASLAGSQSLSNNVARPAPTAVAIAQATATEYLRLNGYTNGVSGATVSIAFPTSTPVPPSTTPSTVIENVSISLTQDHPTAFWPLFNIYNVRLNGAAGARAARNMVDIMLSLDTTGSMYLSGTSDFLGLRQAVADFITQTNPTTTDPRGPKIGIARFAGIKCGWTRTGTGADGDTLIDVRPSGTPNEYATGCTDDMNVLTNLTADRATLLQIANATGGVTCPAGNATTYGCPLKHVAYTAPVVAGAATVPTGLTTSAGNRFCALPNGAYTGYTLATCTPTWTGTKLPNSLNVLSGGGFYAWAAANGGRDGTSTGGNARKVAVLMTDGQNEGWPDEGPQQTPGTWDTQFTTAAAALKLGPDGTAGTADDVEIFVVGFFCVPFSSSTTAFPARWCKSQIAGTSLPHPCPGPVWPPAGVTPSAIDTLLRTASSSTAGTCDHYYPIGKTESLPQLFQQLASTISRARLTN